MSPSDDAAVPAAPLLQEPAGSGTGAARLSLAQRATEEAKRYLAFAAYLIVVFGTLILFSVNIYARMDQEVQHYPNYHFYALGLVNALVLAKIMLLAEAVKMGTRSVGRRLQDGPLVYAILYRSLLFTVVLLAAHLLEEVLVGAWHGMVMSEVLPEIAGGPRGLASFAWVMFVALIPYFAYREVDRVLGEARLRSLLLGHAGQRRVEQAAED